MDLSVSTTLGAVLAAFREADALVQRLKVRCVSRRIALPPDLLEQTINQAPGEIDRVKQRGVERFGIAFEQGDPIALIAIQHATIQLQTGLLDSLRSALDGSEDVDYTRIIDYADSARDGVLAALFALRQRLVAPGAPNGGAVYGYGAADQSQGSGFSTLAAPMRPYAVSHSSPASSFVAPPAPVRESSLNAPPVPVRDDRRRASQWVDPYFPGRDPPHPGPPPHGPPPPLPSNPSSLRNGRQGSSFFGVLRRRDTSTTPSDQSFHESYDQRYQSPSNASSGVFGNAPGAPYVVSPIEGAAAYEFHNQTQHQREPAHSSPPHQDQSFRLSRSTISSDSRTNSIYSLPSSNAPATTSPPLNQPPGISERLTNPTPENNYLGFCEGAWKVQNGDPKAMLERRDFTQSAQSRSTYPSCSKCAFKGHVPSKTIWTKVFIDETRGLKYRWAFLAKSHVKQKSVRERNYAYQCLFCVFWGVPRKQVVYSQEAYLDHIVAEHRSQLLDSVLLYRTNCVIDRVCGNGEVFDINIFPAAARGMGGYDPQMKSDDAATALPHLTAGLGAFELAG